MLLPFMALNGCKKSEGVRIPNKSGFIIYVKKNTKLSTGELVANNTKAGAIHVWKSDGKDFEISSTNDAINGFAYDKISKKSIKADYTYVSTFTESKETDAGKYFIFVILDNNQSNGGNLAYSYTNFTIDPEKFPIVTKTFASSTIAGSFQDWNKND